MTTIRINERTKEGKALLQYLENLSCVEIETQKNPYNPAFIKKVKAAEKNVQKGETITINSRDIWGSLGLK